MKRYDRNKGFVNFEGLVELENKAPREVVMVLTEREFEDGTYYADKVTELVRCRNCEYWSGEYNSECEHPNWYTGTNVYFVTQPDFFCGYGEKK